MYSHLSAERQCYRATQTARYCDTHQQLCCVYLAVKGRDIRMLSILEPGVASPNFTPRSYTRLNSTYLQQEYARWWILCVSNRFT